jgi:Transposase
MSGKIGIDVSKLKLDVAWLMDNGKYRTKVLSNDLAGFKALVVWIQANVAPTSDAVHVCMEATGAYHEALALHLHDYGLHHAGLCVSVVNPIIVKRFLECDKVRNKTDGGDAKGLARFCLEKAPEPWEAPTPGVRALQALVLRLHTVELMRQGELNRLATAHASVRASIQAVIANLDEAITQVRAQIKATIDDDPDLKGRQALLHTIAGVRRQEHPTAAGVHRQARALPNGQGVDCVCEPIAAGAPVRHVAEQAKGHAPHGQPRSEECAVLPRDGGRAVQPAGGQVLEPLEGTTQTRLGDRGGVHAQAPGDHLRCLEVQETLRSRLSKA